MLDIIRSLHCEQFPLELLPIKEISLCENIWHHFLQII